VQHQTNTYFELNLVSNSSFILLVNGWHLKKTILHFSRLSLQTKALYLRQILFTLHLLHHFDQFVTYKSSLRPFFVF